MNETPNFFAIIPANVRYDKSLPANAKLLYGEITALASKEGYCYASNAYFSRCYDVTPQAVSKWISQLVDAGYIKSVLIRDGKTIKERRLYVLGAEGYQQKDGGVSTNVCEGYQQKIKESITKRVIQENNINIAPELELVPEEASAAPSVPQDTSLFNALKDSFLAVTPVFSNWGKEAKNIKTIEDRVRKLDLDDPMHCAKMVLSTYLNLTRTGSEFWRGQPFTPSALASSGIWDRVLVELRRGEEEKAAVNDTSWVE